MPLIIADQNCADVQAQHAAMASIGPALTASRLAWSAEHTGGGQYAWASVAADGGGTFYICDDGHLGYDDSSEFWVWLGLNDDDGEGSGDAWSASAPTMAEAVQLAEAAAGARAFALAFRAAPATAVATPNPDEVERLAVAFLAECKATYSGDEMAAIRQRNREYLDDGCGDSCATHDFADANMIMLDAFTKTFGREPNICKEGATDAQHNADATLWGTAWALTCRRDLTSPRANLLAAAITARDMLAAHMSETFGPDESEWRSTVFWDAYSLLCEALS